MSPLFIATVAIAATIAGLGLLAAVVLHETASLDDRLNNNDPQDHPL